MPQDSVAAKLASAKKTLSDIASKKFPSMSSGNGNAGSTPAKPTPKASTVSSTALPAHDDVLGAQAHARAMHDAMEAAGIPTRHKGGLISKDGPYLLKAGEHVLTSAEAKQAKKHALMASGMKSLAKSGRG